MNSQDSIDDDEESDDKVSSKSVESSKNSVDGSPQRLSCTSDWDRP